MALSPVWKNFEAEKLAREASEAKLKEAEKSLQAEKEARENAYKVVEEEKSRRLAMDSALETREPRLFVCEVPAHECRALS